MKEIVDILIQHGKGFLKSLLFQIPLFIVMLCLWSNPYWLEFKQGWVLHIRDGVPLVVIFILVVWVVEIVIWVGGRLKFREDAKKRVRQLITSNHFYSSYLENNFLYTIYNEKLKKFSFKEICTLAKEKDWTTPEGIEKTIESFLTSGILKRKKEFYIVPSYIWNELLLFSKSKQLRWKR